MKRISAVVLFFLLSVTAPAHAVTLPIITGVQTSFATEGIDVIFGNGLEEVGSLTFINANMGVLLPQPEAINWSTLTLDFAGAPVPNGPFTQGGMEIGNDIYRFYDPGPNAFNEYLTINAANFPNLTFADFTLNGVTGIGGFAICEGGCDIETYNNLPTPLPATLPLFGTGIIGLAGVAYRRKKTGEVSR